MENKGISRKKLKKDIKKGIYYAQNSRRCKLCGHAMLLGGRDKIVCSWCGRFIFKDDKTEFEYKLNKAMRKGLI